MAKIGSSQTPASPLGGRRIGGAGPGGPAPGAESTGPGAAGRPPVADATPTTLLQRLENATRAGALMAVPAAYEDGQDWKTLLGEDVFAKLYLAAPLYAQITDAQVAANKELLAGFWERKLRRLTTGDRDLEDIYRPGTIGKAADLLAAAAATLADAAGRAACFQELERRRREAAQARMAVYMRPQLVNKIMRPEAINLAVAEGQASGFTLAEAQQYVPDYLRKANFAPIKTPNQSPNLLLAIWTEGGLPLADQPHTIVLGQKVYSLTEAGQVLYQALTGTERDKAARNLDSQDYLENIAKDLKENDVQLDLREISQDKKLTQAQRRLKALYLLGPNLPFYQEGMAEAFSSPTQLLARVARSARDFGVAEAAFTAGLLPIWVQASAAASIKAALPGPGKTKALDFRHFLHKAAPTMPLWIGEEAFTSGAQLAAYIRRDEQTWKMVYGSLSAGNLHPWLYTMGQTEVMERHAELADALRGPDVEPTSEVGRQLAVQALLSLLDPQVPNPNLNADLREVNLTGLSGEASVSRTLTLTNETGGYQRVFLAVAPALEGVSISPTELYFDQRAPGQRLTTTITGSPAQMPRDGQHTAQVTIRTAYVRGEVPVKVEAVFPQKEFWQFVGGAALALAVIFGGVRYALGLALGEATYGGMMARGTLLPLRQAVYAGSASGFVLVAIFVLWVVLLYSFVRVLLRLAKPKPGA